MTFCPSEQSSLKKKKAGVNSTAVCITDDDILEGLKAKEKEKAKVEEKKIEKRIKRERKKVRREKRQKKERRKKETR